MGQWFLAINMLAAFNGFHGCKSVVMVGRGDYYSFDFLHLIEHFAIVGELLCLRVLFENVGGMLLIDITQSDDVLAFHVLEVRASLAPNADASNIEFFVPACSGSQP